MGQAGHPHLVRPRGPPLRRTRPPVLDTHKTAFAYQKMGYAATIGLALAVAIFAVLILQRRLVGKAEVA